MNISPFYFQFLVLSKKPKSFTWFVMGSIILRFPSIFPLPRDPHSFEPVVLELTSKFSKEHGCISTFEFLSFSHYLLSFHSERWGLRAFLSHPPLMPTLPFPALLPLGECPVLLGLGHWSQFTPSTAPPVIGPPLDCNHSLTGTCFILTRNLKDMVYAFLLCGLGV